MKALITSAITLAAGTLFASTAEWTPGATSLADGAVRVEYSGASISRLTASPSDAKLTLTGGEAMPFADGAQVVVSNGTLRFETPLTGAGALAVRYVADNVVWDAVECGRNDYLPQSEADAVVVATGLKLDDLTVYRGAAGWKLRACYWGNGDNNVKPYFIERGEGTFSCQMQHVSDVWTKCIWLNLKQVGDDIVAWTPKVGYAHYQNVAPLGTDFRTIKYTSAGCSCIKTQTAGYGLDGLTLIPNDNGAVRVEVANGLNLAGQLTVGAGLTLVADGPTALTTNGVWTTPLVINGTFRLTDPYDMTMGGKVTFGVSGRYEGVVETARPRDGFSLDAPKWPSASWTTFATNLVLAAVTNVTAETGGCGWWGFGTKLNRAWLETDGSLLTIQLAKKWDGAWIKGVVYQIRQAGPYLQHRILRAAAMGTNVDFYTLDLRKDGTNQGVYTGTGTGYGLQNIQIHFKGGVSQCNLRLTNAVVRSPRGETYFAGLADAPLSVTCDATGDMPENLKIGAFASFNWNSDGNQGNSGATSVTIDENGSYVYLKTWSWGISNKANLNGGTFSVLPTWSTTDAVNIYLEFVNFLNGGTVADNIPRVGYYYDPVWTVRGAKPATIEKGLGVVGNGDGTGSPFNRAIFLDVADVTGSDDPDLFINGKIYYSNDSWKMAHVVKLGAGKVRHNGVMSVNTYPMVISNGTWQVTQSNGIVAGCGLELSGGALELNANCSLSLGALTVGAFTTNTVALGAASAISFASLGAVDHAQVNFTSADPTKKVRIGTGRTLTSAQRRALKINGKGVHQDESGYLVEGPAGSVVIVK